MIVYSVSVKQKAFLTEDEDILVKHLSKFVKYPDIFALFALLRNAEFFYPMMLFESYYAHEKYLNWLKFLVASEIAYDDELRKVLDSIAPVFFVDLYLREPSVFAAYNTLVSRFVGICEEINTIYGASLPELNGIFEIRPFPKNQNIFVRVISPSYEIIIDAEPEKHFAEVTQVKNIEKLFVAAAARSGDIFEELLKAPTLDDIRRKGFNDLSPEYSVIIYNSHPDFIRGTYEASILCEHKVRALKQRILHSLKACSDRIGIVYFIVEDEKLTLACALGLVENAGMLIVIDGRYSVVKNLNFTVFYTKQANVKTVKTLIPKFLQAFISYSDQQ